MSVSGELLSGGCQCRAVRYGISARPLRVYVCHCRECQRQSASAFGISVIVPREAVRLTQGSPRIWSRSTDSGRTLDCAFCPACGTRLWHQGREAGETVSIKGGSLDEPVDLRAAVHIWTSRALQGVIPEDAVCFPGEPDEG